jgi:hypothetical protein
LEDYFHDVSPPTDGDDMLRFWEALLEINKVLCNIHELRLAKDVPRGMDILQGYQSLVRTCPEDV